MEKMIKTIHSLLNTWMETETIQVKDIPNIDLYMDQVTTFMNEHLGQTKRYEDDKILTKTMINNYTKNDVLPPPSKKKYSKDHMLFLIFIYYFKSTLSINDIQSVLEPLADSFYYDKKKSLPLEAIYEELMQLHKQQLGDIEKDIEKKIALSKEAFSSIKDKDKELLFLFSFISLINYETYMKKHILEKLIDTYFHSEND